MDRLKFVVSGEQKLERGRQVVGHGYFSYRLKETFDFLYYKLYNLNKNKNSIHVT